MDSYILAADIGTSSCKAALFTDQGKLLALGKGKYPLFFPQEGYVEQEPEMVFKGMCEAVSKLKEKGYDLSKVAAVSFSAQIASQCLVDKNGNPLTNLLSWMDTRAWKEAESFRHSFSREETEKLTGVDMVVTPAYSISKLCWLKSHSNLFNKAYKFVQIKDYIIWKLTGNWVSDVTSMKGLVHPLTKELIPEILDFIGVSEELFPQVKEPNEIAGYLRKNVAGLEELPEGIPVITGWNDMNAAFLGMGALTGSDCVGMDLTGTSEHLGCVGMSSTQYSRKYGGINRVPYLNGREVFYGVTSSGGQAVEWFVKDFMKAADVSQYLNEVFENNEILFPQEEGVIFLPYLEGERNPWNNPLAQGVLFGLKRNHTQKEVAAAVLEGVCFALRAIYDCLPQKPGKVVVSGGASLNNIWNQMKADVMNVPFVRLKNTEAGCVGAAVLALSALFPEKSMEQLSERFLKAEQEYIPDSERHWIYEKKYHRFLELYRCLDREFWNKEEKEE